MYEIFQYTCSFNFLVSRLLSFIKICPSKVTNASFFYIQGIYAEDLLHSSKGGLPKNHKCCTNNPIHMYRTDFCMPCVNIALQYN